MRSGAAQGYADPARWIFWVVIMGLAYFYRTAHIAQLLQLRLVQALEQNLLLLKKKKLEQNLLLHSRTPDRRRLAGGPPNP